MPGVNTTAVKTCATCQETKHVSNFSRKGAGGRAARCKPCLNARAREAYKTSPRMDPQVKYDYHLRYTYGITAADYAVLLERQGGKCAICEATQSDGGRRLAVDHDHASGRVRGLLCRACNRAIGGLGDSPTLVAKALAYLTAGQD